MMENSLELTLRKGAIFMKPSFGTMNLHTLPEGDEGEEGTVDTIDVEVPQVQEQEQEKEDVKAPFTESDSDEVQELETFMNTNNSDKYDRPRYESDDSDDSISLLRDSVSLLRDSLLLDSNEINHKKECEEIDSHIGFFGERHSHTIIEDTPVMTPFQRQKASHTYSSVNDKPTPATPPFHYQKPLHRYSRDSMMTTVTNTTSGSTTIIKSKKPIKQWYRSLVIRQSCHSHMAEDSINKDMYLNTLSVGLTAITSSAIFTSLAPTNGDTRIKTSGGDNQLAMIAGVLAAINTVLQAVMKTVNYARSGEQHLNAFKGFTKMRFKLENIIGNTTLFDHHDEINEKMLSRWISKYEDLIEMEPIIPEDILEEITEKEDNMGCRWMQRAYESV